MSGGVDSSVAAYLTKQAGFECAGVTLKLFDGEAADACGEKTCCSLDDIEDARSVCLRLGIPYYVYNFKDSFDEQVIARFIRAYESGATPNPCIDCNRYIKFERLARRAEELGFDRVVTGHYAIVTYDEARGVKGSELCTLLPHAASAENGLLPSRRDDEGGGASAGGIT